MAGFLSRLFGRGESAPAASPAPAAGAAPATATATPVAEPPRAGGFDAERGDRLMGADRLDDAEAYFRRHLEGNARAHYGLGLVLARRDTAHLTPERIAESASHFLRAIDLDPRFGDAHLLCGTMQCALAAKHLAAFEKDPSVPSRLADGEALMASAGVHLQRAAELDAGLTKMAVVQARRLQQLAANAQKLRAGGA